MPDIDEIAEAMYKMVKDATGMKKIKPTDLTKAMAERFNADKKTSKQAIKQLVDSGRLIYTYFGGSYLEIPKEE